MSTTAAALGQRNDESSEGRLEVPPQPPRRRREVLLQNQMGPHPMSTLLWWLLFPLYWLLELGEEACDKHERWRIERRSRRR